VQVGHLVLPSASGHRVSGWWWDGLQELVVLAAVAGHRLPHCWRGW